MKHLSYYVPSFVLRLFTPRTTAEVLADLNSLTAALERVEQDQRQVARERYDEAVALRERAAFASNEGYECEIEAQRAVKVRQNILRLIEG
jgi:hypothetical protein